MDCELTYQTGSGMPGDNWDVVPPNTFLYRQDVAHEPLDVQCVRRARGLPLVITFGGSGLNPDTGEAQYAMRNMLREEEVNQISLRDQFCCWFHNGVRGASQDVMTTAAYLQGLIKDCDSERVFCTGTSAGGYAAILFGGLLNVTGVLAVNPQTLLKRGIKCQAHGQLYLLKWTDRDMQQYADLLDLEFADTKVCIIYGADDPVDVYHAERMAQPNVHLFPVPGDHSTSILQSRDNGMITRMLHGLYEETR